MENQNPGVRINKFLSEAGVCSRRAADKEIAEGNVMIGGRTAVPGDRVSEGQDVFFKGEKVVPEQEQLLIAFHKPHGIVCTAQKKEKNNIIDFIHYPKRIYPVGRLDKDSEGLILLTNQGELVNKIMRAGNFHEKEYTVTVDRKITELFLAKMEAGVYLEELDVTTRPCRIQRVSQNVFTIVLTQGYNRQIRRMCEALGYHVVRLVRVRIMNIKLGSLPVGTYRNLTGKEQSELLWLLRDSYSSPTISGEARDKEKRKTEDGCKRTD